MLCSGHKPISYSMHSLFRTLHKHLPSNRTFGTGLTEMLPWNDSPQAKATRNPTSKLRSLHNTTGFKICLSCSVFRDAKCVPTLYQIFCKTINMTRWSLLALHTCRLYDHQYFIYGFLKRCQWIFSINSYGPPQIYEIQEASRRVIQPILNNSLALMHMFINTRSLCYNCMFQQCQTTLMLTERK